MKALHCIFLVFAFLPIIAVPSLARILSVSTHGDKWGLTITIYGRTSPSPPPPPSSSPSPHHSKRGGGATAFDSQSGCEQRVQVKASTDGGVVGVESTSQGKQQLLTETSTSTTRTNYGRGTSASPPPPPNSSPTPIQTGRSSNNGRATPSPPPPPKGNLPPGQLGSTSPPPPCNNRFMISMVSTRDDCGSGKPTTSSSPPLHYGRTRSPPPPPKAAPSHGQLGSGTSSTPCHTWFISMVTDLIYGRIKPRSSPPSIAQDK